MTKTTTRFGATYPNLANVDGDGYTWQLDRLRIVRQGDDEYPWILDAWNRTTGCYSELVWTFETFAQCVASMPDFVAELRREGVEIPDPRPPRTWTFAQMRDELGDARAYELLPDDPMPRWAGEVRCFARLERPYTHRCTRPVGHTGRHHQADGVLVYAVWEDA